MKNFVRSSPKILQASRRGKHSNHTQKKKQKKLRAQKKRCSHTQNHSRTGTSYCYEENKWITLQHKFSRQRLMRTKRNSGKWITQRNVLGHTKNVRAQTISNNVQCKWKIAFTRHASWKKKKKKRDRDKKNAFENGKKGTLQPHKQKKSLILLLKFSRRRVIITKLAFLLNFDLPIKTRLLTAASGKRMDHVYFSLRLFFPTF